MNAELQHAAVALRKAASVVLCAHVRPDGDAIGSVLALTLALREAGIPAVPTLADERPAPSTYSWLPGFGLYAAATDLEAPSVFIALDTPNPERLGVARPLFEAAETVIVIDHHPDAQAFGSIHLIDRGAAATGQIVWDSLEGMGLARSRDVAECCYAAVLTDTGRFQYQNTDPRVLRDAASMLEAGLDASELARHIYQNRSAASLAVEAVAMSRLTLANGGRVAYSWLTDEDFERTGASPEEAEHIPDAVRTLGGVDVVILLREAGDEVRVNLRAKAGADVGSVARAFGGGGHHAAAGLTWNERGKESVLPKLLSMLPGAESA
jgi:phosphoesterase RecJ-like protein